MLAKKYKISHLINKGSFGVIFQGKNMDNFEDVAIKMENPHKFANREIIHEGEILTILGENESIPRLHCVDTSSNAPVIIMQLLGQNLNDLFSLCKKRFSLQTTLFIAIQLLKTLKFLHSKNIIHQDINPRNVCIGIGNNTKSFYIIDFGLSKQMKQEECKRNDEDDEDANKKDKKQHSFKGTLLFASLNSHQGNMLSFKDDLESLVYMILYFLNGTLPWEQHLANKMEWRDLMKKIKEEKQSFNLTQLEKKIPKEIEDLLVYVKGLQNNEIPDYDLIRKKLKTFYRKNFGCSKLNFEWENNKSSSLKIATKEKRILKEESHRSENPSRLNLLKRNSCQSEERVEKKKEETEKEEKDLFYENKVFKKIKIEKNPPEHPTSEKAQEKKESDTPQKKEEPKENETRETEEKKQDQEKEELSNQDEKNSNDSSDDKKNLESQIQSSVTSFSSIKLCSIF